MAETRLTRIYVLRDPRDGEVRYVGKTVFPLDARLARHVHDAKSGKIKRHICFWIRELLIEAVPEIVLLEIADTDWAERERFWIDHYRGLGARLTNHADGGQGPFGFKRPPEQCEAMRASRLGKAPHQWSQEAKDKLSKTLTGRKSAPKSAEHKRKISEALSGRPMTDETRARLLKANTGRKKTSEELDRFKLSRTGKPGFQQTGASIAKQLETKTAWTPEQRAAVGNAISAGMHLASLLNNPAETRAKRSETMKRIRATSPDWGKVKPRVE
jgi:hypothetical protein